MDEIEISERLKWTLLKALGLGDFIIRRNTRADEVPGWDSLNHVRVILAVEKEFEIRLKGLEVLRLKNIGDLQDLIDSKIHPG